MKYFLESKQINKSYFSYREKPLINIIIFVKGVKYIT